MRPVQLGLGRFLGLFGETMADDHHFALVEKAEDSTTVAAHLHPDFIQLIGAGEVLEVKLGNLVQVLDHAQGPQNLLFDLIGLGLVKVAEVVFEEEQATLFWH